MNVAVKSADKPKGEHKIPQVIKKVGIVGAGQMGTGHRPRHRAGRL